jgi:hypothetical protein
MRRALLGWSATVIACAAIVGGALAASTNFTEPRSSPEHAGDGSGAAVAADLDGDGDQDLAVANQGSGDVTILKNKGNGDFVEPVTSPEISGSIPAAIVAGDWDNDTDQDLAVANFGSASVTILRNTGSGNFVQPASSPESVGGGPDELVADDLDGDLDLDLAVANSSTGNVTILFSLGGGDFHEPASSPEPSGGGPRGIAAGDLDADGDADLAVANQLDDSVAILRNDGFGDFRRPVTSPEATGDGPQSLVVTNLDLDPDLDIATANAGSTQDLTILRNNGSANFFEATSSPEPLGQTPVAVGAADFDLDGDADLAAPMFMVDQIAILRNNGKANFTQPTTSPESTGDAPFWPVAADFDGDLDPDLAVPNINSDDVTILRNR